MKEAKALLNSGMPDGAYYLAGYAVECALKACIAKETKRHEFPDKKRAELSYTHSLRDLVRVAGLADDCKDYMGRSREFESNWQTVQAWSEQSRYQRQSLSVGRALVSAVVDRRNGVMRWIRQYW